MTGRVSVMTTHDCWALLREQELGRLAFRLGEGVQITPVNYAVDGDRIIFRTAEGTKLTALHECPEVAFEVEHSTDEAAMSVVARGRAVQLHGDEALMADQLRLRPWFFTVKEHVIAIEVTEVSGRFFYLSKPWQHLLLHCS